MLPISRRPEFWIIVAAIAAGVGTWMGRTLQRQRMKRRLAEIERQQALEHERARIARDLHDDIGAGLTEIAMKSALVRRDLERIPTPETRRHIDRVCQSAIELTRSVDEIVWAVNPANDTLNHFVNYLTQSTEQFLDATGLRVRFDLPPSIPALELSGKTRHLVFLAVREALNNAVKHAAAKLIRLEIKVADGGLRIVVEDDGQGFAPKQELSAGTHEGLKNMQRRMAEIGGQFQLTSRPEGGTRVEFCLSLPERRNQR